MLQSKLYLDGGRVGECCGIFEMCLQGCVQKCKFGMKSTTTVLSRKANLAVKGLKKNVLLMMCQCEFHDLRSNFTVLHDFRRKFSLQTFLALHGALGNLTPCKSETLLYPEIVHDVQSHIDSCIQSEYIQQVHYLNTYIALYLVHQNYLKTHKPMETSFHPHYARSR